MNEGEASNESGNSGLVDRMSGWVSERPLAKFFERRARGQIAEAVKQDIKDPINFSKQQVMDATHVSRAKVDGLVSQGDQVFSVENKDSVTKEPFITRFRKTEDGAVVAEEVKQGGAGNWLVVSQAKISPDGKTSLTLSFKGPRYEGSVKSRNPGIIEDVRFPRATVATFNLLVGTIRG